MHIFRYQEAEHNLVGGGGGRFQKKIKGSSSVGVAATPLKPLSSCYRVKRRGD